VQRVKEASPDALAEVVGPAKAEKVVDYFTAQVTESTVANRDGRNASRHPARRLH